MIARSLGILEHRLFASPQYLAGAGALESPTDLAQHRCIVYRHISRWNRWEFESEHGRHSIEVTGTVRVDDAEAIRDAALAGLGVAQLPDWLLGSAVEDGRLTPLLSDYYLIPQPVRFIYPQTRFLTQRARCFIDFVIANRETL
jgi:DNA-binding transcriptional LysR family regulator